MTRPRSNRFTRRQVYILAALFIAVVLVFALAAYLSLPSHLASSTADLRATLYAIDQNRLATITAIYSR